MYGDKLSWFQRFMQRFQPTPEVMAMAELKDAELAALQSESMAEYAALRVSIHNLTAAYHKARMVRLSGYIGKSEGVAMDASLLFDYKDGAFMGTGTHGFGVRDKSMHHPV